MMPEENLQELTNVLAEARYRYQIEADIAPFRGLLLGLFFITTGFSIDIALAIQQWPIVVFGALAAFYYPRNGLLGLWWGMTLAVWLHVFSYLLICFARPCLRFAIDWKQAAKVAAERLAEPAADAAAAINSVEPIVVAPVG